MTLVFCALTGYIQDKTCNEFLKIMIHIVKERHFLTLHLLVCCLLSALYAGQQTPLKQNRASTLPQYSIYIDPQDLQALYEHPYRNEYVPALFRWKTMELQCQIRLRGGSTRTLPKKSWRLKFPNAQNPFSAEHINLNAEYRDRSFMRNHLALSLFRHRGHPAPHTQHIALFINDTYMGVYLEIEDIKDEFFENRNIRTNQVYKAKNHAASMAPLASYADYPLTWEVEEGEPKSFHDVHELFCKLYLWSPSEFAHNIEQEIDIENVLNYFAIEFAIFGLDCFTKNVILYFNQDTHLWQVLPWDNDATFGYDYKGTYHSEYETSLHIVTLDHQLLFQRLMEHEQWREQFDTSVEHIITDGFDYASALLDSTCQHIRNEVYRDSLKICSNAEFETAQIELCTFLDNRKEFLLANAYPERISVTRTQCSNPFPHPQEPDIVFRATANQPASVQLVYCRNVSWYERGQPIKLETLPLYDDGQHNDLNAGDLVYGNTLSVEGWEPGLVPYCYQINELHYPANGLFYINFVRTQTLAFCVSKEPRQPDDIQLGRIYRTGEVLAVDVLNTTPNDVEVSYCQIGTASTSHNFWIPALTHMAAHDTLWVTSKMELHERFDHPMVGNLGFDIHLGDTVQLRSPAGTLLQQKVVTRFASLDTAARVVINELNNNSADAFDSEDWIELYNPNAHKVDVSLFQLKDADNDHSFTIPAATILGAQDFFVLCRDTEAFLAQYPNERHYCGPFEFGFNSTEDQVRLYSPYGELVDSVAYSVDAGWPALDEAGYTLELLHPDLDNALASNWQYSKQPHGTPGAQNSIYNAVPHNEKRRSALDAWIALAPNPFNHTSRIRFQAPMNSKVEIQIYNLRGQRVDTLRPSVQQSQMTFHAFSLPTGMYFFQLKIDGTVRDVQKAMVLK